MRRLLQGWAQADWVPAKVGCPSSDGPLHSKSATYALLMCFPIFHSSSHPDNTYADLAIVADLLSKLHQLELKP